MRAIVKTVVVLIVVVIVTSSYFLLAPLLDKKESIVIYSADAYKQEADFMIDSYHNATGISIDPAQAGGSFAVAREIGGGTPANVFISVALNSYEESYLGPRYSGWAVAFAADQLVLAYSPKAVNTTMENIISKFSTALNTSTKENYQQAFAALTSGKVNIGIANASQDPAGLRGYVSLEIAGYLFANGSEQAYIDALQNRSAIVGSTNAAALVSALTSGDISFLYIYKSAAISDGLNYITLEANLSFGDPSLSSFYGTFSYPSGDASAAGSTIYLFVSVLANNSQQAASMKFALYVMNNSNSLSRFGLQPLVTGILFSSVTPPSQIGSMVNSGSLKNGGTL